MAALDVESMIRDSDKANMSKACVANWASTRKATGTLTTYFINDQGDRFWVKANAMINERNAAGFTYPKLISDIDIHCNVTGKESIVIEYRAKKNAANNIKKREETINDTCKNGFRDAFFKNTDWDKRWASVIEKTTKTNKGRTLNIETLSASGKTHYSDVQCNTKGDFLNYKTIKVTEPSIHGGYKTLKHKMTP